MIAKLSPVIHFVERENISQIDFRKVIPYSRLHNIINFRSHAFNTLVELYDWYVISNKKTVKHKKLQKKIN